MSTSDVFSTSTTKSSPQGQTRSGELREEICQKIEEDIATGVLRPGARLDEAELAARFSISRTPVREAFIQLAAVGILDLRPRRGAVVPELSPRRLIEMIEVMASFSEHEAVVESLLRGDADRAAEQLRNHVLVQGQRFTDLMAMLHGGM